MTEPLRLVRFELQPPHRADPVRLDALGVECGPDEQGVSTWGYEVTAVEPVPIFVNPDAVATAGTARKSRYVLGRHEGAGSRSIPTKTYPATCLTLFTRGEEGASEFYVVTGSLEDVAARLLDDTGPDLEPEPDAPAGPPAGIKAESVARAPA